jgi:hypothetical protein
MRGRESPIAVDETFGAADFLGRTQGQGSSDASDYLDYEEDYDASDVDE